VGADGEGSLIGGIAPRKARALRTVKAAGVLPARRIFLFSEPEPILEHA